MSELNKDYFKGVETAIDGIDEVVKSIFKMFPGKKIDDLSWEMIIKDVRKGMENSKRNIEK